MSAGSPPQGPLEGLKSVLHRIPGGDPIHPTEVCEVIHAPIHYVSNNEETEAVRACSRTEDEKTAAHVLLDLSLGPRHWSALRAHGTAVRFGFTELGVRPIVFPLYESYLESRQVFYFAITDTHGKVLQVLKSDYGGGFPHHLCYEPSSINR